MLLTLASWIYIFAVLCASGLILSAAIDRFFKFRIEGIHSVIMLGLAGVTVYAETFSIFHKLGEAAVIGLSVLCIAGTVFARKRIRNIVTGWISEIKGRDKGLTVCLMMVAMTYIFLGAFLALRVTQGYDEYNYHIPTIRWLEEFGVVKGLGNLHTRFGYNSAFLCLQALFSFSWLLQVSLHSMNAWIWVFMMTSCTVSLCWFSGRRFALSDLLKILTILLLSRYGLMLGIAAPDTDFFPLCITAYVFIRWSRLIEKKGKNAVPYGLAAMLGLFGATVKLSAGILFLFAAWPLMQCLREKDYRMIGKFMLVGILLLVPFLARNVIITGYLLYPLASIDLFSVDWKIPKSVVVSDNAIIKLFARSNAGDYRYEYLSRSFFEWFKIWAQTAENGYNALGMADLVLAVLVLIKAVLDWIRHKMKNEYLSVLLMAAIGIVFLFVTAPSTRFGIWWFFALPLVSIYSATRRREAKTDAAVFPAKRVKAFCGILVLMCGCTMAAIFLKQGNPLVSKTLVTPPDYVMTGADSESRMINGIRHYFYTPDPERKNHLNGYDGFPGTETLATLSRIEMRGDSLKDGYRPKEEYKQIPYDFQGYILTKEAALALGLDSDYDLEMLTDYRDIGYVKLIKSE